MLCFWAKDETDEYGIPRKPDWVHDFGEWLAHGSVEPDPEVGEIRSFGRERPLTWLYRFLLWIDGFKKRTVHVHIDEWDTWSMDDTLALIVLPMLKQLKQDKHGAPWVDPEDVPEELHPPQGQENAWNNGDVDDNHHARWDWVLDEMIFAFENKLDEDWEDQFRSGDIDFVTKKLDNGNYELLRGPRDTSETDWEGMKAYQKRISNGFMLFGKYYEALWT